MRITCKLFRLRYASRHVDNRGHGLLNHHALRYQSVCTKECPFEKILVANRGEIACRIIKSAKKLGIKTVAIYSSADVNALHVRLADEAVCVGKAASFSSYLNSDRIIQAAKDTGSEAVHPGYGFLSESADFTTKLNAEGITFIGPSPEVLQKMGDKIAAKELAMSVGMNCIPSYKVTSLEDCLQAADKLGYPIIIKALAGGGGKGMRVARSNMEIREGFKLSEQEVLSCFTNGELFIEKYIESPHHIEVQILGDQYGNIIHLYERECSIQRRYQKVIEECPSPLLSGEQRSAIGEQAVALCKAVGYYSAGTVEFLVDGTNIYFLEVNPRLQVEHPVTELVTGVDLVHQMFRIAKGYALNLKQHDVHINGWAIECRVYAEDPFIDFGLPSVGRIHTYSEPCYMPNVRLDSGVEEGTEINIHYDPLISKVICHGESRDAAVRFVIDALDCYVIRGVKHNISLLRDVLSQQQFQNGNLSINFMQKVYPRGFSGFKLNEAWRNILYAAACCIYVTGELKLHNSLKDPNIHISTLKIWNLEVSLLNDVDVKIRAKVVVKNDFFKVHIKGIENEIEVKNDINLARLVLVVWVDKCKYNVQLVSRDATGKIKIIFNGSTFVINVMTELTAQYSQHLPKRVKPDCSKYIFSPMPGRVVTVFCADGDTVLEGQELLVMEAMKMQNSVCASSSGKIKYVKTSENKTVAKNELLVEFV